MPKIRYYDDSELEGLTDDQLAHLRLVSRVIDLDDFADADASQLEQLTDEQLREILGDAAPPVVVAPVEPAPRKERKKRESRKPAPPVIIPPRTIGEAFALVDGRLMRRRVARVEVVQRDGERFTREVEHFAPCGGRVRFGGRVYSAAVVLHYLQTGELVERVPRAKVAPRYRARVRTPEGLLHLGYFATVEERDAAIFAYRLGIFPNGSKSA